MIPETILIAGSAASVGFIHTILGPDHYLPLVAMAKTNGWSGPKTATYTAFCGFSHVLGTILVGSLVFLLGLAFFSIETVQSFRGNFAGWFLLLFGAIYFAWGTRWAIRRSRLNKAAKKMEAQTTSFSRCTPFALFIFFILGPCEPLIPLMSLGSGNSEILSSLLVVSAFCGTTILTMLFCVMFFYYGVSRFSLFMKFENYMHAVTGLIIFLCGSAIQFLGA
jgi:nickel/cobalt exporter